MLLTTISVLILLFSLVLIYHITTNESPSVEQPDETEEENSIAEISSEIDNVLLNETSQIDIGEMI